MGEIPGQGQPYPDTTSQFHSLLPVEEQRESDVAILDLDLDLPNAIDELQNSPYSNLSSSDKILMVADAVGWYLGTKEHQYSEKGVRRYDRDARLLTDREGFAEFLSSQIGHTGITLETAAGTGLVTQMLLKNASKLVATDTSDAALGILSNRMGLSAKIAKADFLSLPFRDKSFDTVVCVGGYRYVPADNKSLYWDEAKRVLRKDGRLIIGQFHPRGVPINGLDLTQDEANRQEKFGLRSLRRYESRIRMPLIKVRSGSYDLFEFTAR